MIGVEIAFLALLLLLLPLGSARQLQALDPQELRRIPAYLESIATILALGLIGLWLGVRRFGWAGLGLDLPIPVGVWAGRALLLTAVSVGVMEGFDRARRRSGRSESLWVQALLPRTASEKAVFALLSVAAGVGEEIAYRGFAMRLLAFWTGSVVFATAVTALAFGWVHAYQGTFGRVRAATLGALLTVPVLLGWGLWPSIAAHTLIDWIGGLVLGSRWIQDPRPTELTDQWNST